LSFRSCSDSRVCNVSGLRSLKMKTWSGPKLTAPYPISACVSYVSVYGLVPSRKVDQSATQYPKTHLIRPASVTQTIYGTYILLIS
jgi:hypothetical protein